MALLRTACPLTSCLALVARQRAIALPRAQRRWLLRQTRSLATVAPHSHHQVQRSKRFKELNASDVEAFRSMLSKSDSSVLTTIEAKGGKTLTADELTPFNHDWMQKYKGDSKLVLKPRSTEEVSKILAYCVKNKIAMVPQGGNTGLVGGSVPIWDEVVISLSGMDNIRHFDPISGVMTADAGCILQVLDDRAAKEGFMMPLDLGAKGSCQIGGNLATNAGGLRLLRYGNLHGSVLGLEVVLPDERGTVLKVGMGGLRKDNTGYDLKQLFIGSEGTLGLITAVSILTPKRPASVNVAMLALSSYEAVQKVYIETRSHLAEILSAFEFVDQEAFELVLSHTGTKRPFEGGKPDARQFYVLIETSGSKKEHDDEKLTGLLEDLMEKEIIVDGVLAQDETQLQSLWSLRESIPEAAGKLGKTYKFDVSMPVSEMYGLVEATRQRFKDQGMADEIREVVGYGHIGDGNLHLNVVAKRFDQSIEDVLEPWVFEYVSQRNGSISAEHGLGQQKAPFVGYSQAPESIATMRAIKALFDKQGLLQPSKYLPAADEGVEASSEAFKQ
ncbi:uncharacterized protein L969DRAFT_96371 [Mixia osmundae IAM 14324]|uniref:FAD-binding PCMH-type domain-containing protein n=1 Tax=Mixia osmundae (strain CBS 9802 / IAM 14324 / JCM 22182 / KY 12970) TaxID=764103 RepID=G7DWE2_MIXOS|nr:uncharacterized protein L969DRAFT_96371 [Mixia osmundae IAM 14324]KEI37285.1 hypothetical protein L969DRAFT_96371 [Mixia osmundae IAM 14324]GAA94902.1 hypothetical protein E5Q_01557 [Mixia osmundae IAM 14324]